MKVKLNKDHTHAGKQHKAGEEIDVPAHDAKWLADNEVIDPLQGSTSKRGQAAEESAK